MMSNTRVVCSLVVLACLLVAASSAAAHQGNVLVVLEDLKLRNTHSLFFSSLESRGYVLDYKAADDRTLRLRDWDTYLYEKIVLFASTKALGGALDVKGLIEYFDDGHDLILAVDQRASDELRALAEQLGVDLDSQGSTIVDYVNSVGSDSNSVAADALVNSTAVIGKAPIQAPTIFSGIGMTISPESETVFKVLGPRNTAYSKPLKQLKDSIPVAGPNVVLVAAVQARNNARAVVAGSLEMFSNKAFQSSVEIPQMRTYARSGNQLFATAISKWAFHESGVLKAGPLTHWKLGSPPDSGPPAKYRINDEIELAVDIQEMHNGKWGPYRADDVQFEFVMLDPYVRQTFTHDNQGHFTAAFKVPDTYGMFKFLIDHRRLGYSYISAEHVVPVEPFRHNEFERFLVAAYPYYTSAISMMAGFFILGLVFLYTK